MWGTSFDPLLYTKKQIILLYVIFPCKVMNFYMRFYISIP